MQNASTQLVALNASVDQDGQEMERSAKVTCKPSSIFRFTPRHVAVPLVVLIREMNAFPSYQ